MKRILSITGILALAILFTSAISIRETPQDPPRGKKGKKHIKVVQVKNGERVEIDTVIASEQVFVVNGDTVDVGKEMKWVMKEDMDFDFDMDVDADGESNVFVFKTGDDSAKHIQVRKMMINGDSEDILRWHSKGGNEMIIGAPHGVHAPKIIRIDKKGGGNVIDLSDPGIISFEKKDLKDGKEKIVIVRKKPSKEEVEVHEEIIMHGSHSAPMIIHESHPKKVKQIKVIAGDEGKIEILEDGKVWSIDEMEEGTKVIEEDGKKIIIKKQKKGEEIKVDVEVEEKEEKEHK